MTPRALLVPSLLAALLIAETASSQPRPRERASSAVRRSFKASLGLEAVRHLLRSDDSADRCRAFDRLSKLGTETALEILARALDLNGAARDGRERLAATRALAPHARVAVARTALIRSLSAPSALERADPSQALARSSAALALAKSGDVRALGALGQALRQPGRSAEVALSALRAYPPADPTPVLAARGAITAPFIDYLETLDHPRASSLLHGVAQKATHKLRARALIALARRNDPEVARLAARAHRNERHPELFRAYVEVLARAGHPDAQQAFAQLCEAAERDPRALEAAVEIALHSPSPSFARSLERLLQHAQRDQVPSLVAALGRASDERSIATLARLLNHEVTRFSAALALALSEPKAAREALERALSGDAALRRTALRASAVRALALGDPPSGARTLAKELVRSKLPADRAAAAFAWAVLEPDRSSELLSSQDPVVVRAAARTLLTTGFAELACERLARETNELTRSALALCLADDVAALKVPNRVLEALLETSDAAAPLAARALAARDSARLRPRIEHLLASSDAIVRAHVASGLGLSQEPSAVGLLTRTYMNELDPRVRRAIVIALSTRHEPGRSRALALAAALDPDDETRELARQALVPQQLWAFVAGKGTAWVEVQEPLGDEAVTVAAPGGLTLPSALDPDGFAGLSGLPFGSFELDLAKAARADQGSPRKP